MASRDSATVVASGFQAGSRRKVARGLMELRSNKEVEDAAIAWVCQREREAGRTPEDMRGRGSPVDIVSPPRMIEVKAYGRSARGEELFMEAPQMEEAERNPDFYLYVVEHVRQGDPAHFTLKLLSGEDLHSLLARAKEHRYFTVPWPVSHYDAIEPDLGAAQG